jgi:hypothetical protein
VNVLRYGLLLPFALTAFTAAAVSGCVDRGLERSWESFLNRADRVRAARRTLEELGRKHGARPVEEWPAIDRALRAIATHALRDLGEEP